LTIPLAFILLVDDDPDLLLTLGMVLESAGYTVITAADAAQALRLAARTDFHVALVDYRLHGSSMSGLELIARLHEVNPLTVSLLMTVHDRGEVGFLAAQAGAFAYLAKPFSHEALLDAVRAALEERLRREQMRDCLHIGDLVIELAARSVTLVGEPVSLSPLEFELLAYLAGHSRRVVGYGELWGEVWGYHGPPDKRVIHKALSRLRKRIGKDRLVCVRGRGYLLR
jgi:two-component system response regulator MtrA